MNQPTTYEQLIAQKLNELDVPDQANAIWATIEHQLNIEMPVDGTGSGYASDFYRWIGGGSLLTFVIAAFTYILVSKQQPESERKIHEKPPIVQPKPAEDAKDAPEVSLQGIPTKVTARPTEHVPASEQSAKVPQQASRDTVVAPAPKVAEPPATMPIKTDTTVTRKKPRGVTGITDADYRLVPSQKDTVKRKN